MTILMYTLPTGQTKKQQDEYQPVQFQRIGILLIKEGQTMSVTFTGLASGIDTASIVESIIELESAPIDTMQSEQEYLGTKLDAYTEFNTLLETFYSSALSLNDESDFNSYEVTNSGEDYFSISTTSLANEGSYSVEVVSLAQQQKDIGADYIADTDTTLLSGELQIGEETLTYTDVTLGDLVDMINEGEYGVTGTMVNDGSLDETGAENGYRLMLTAESSGEAIEITGTGSLAFDTSANGHTVEGARAHVLSGWSGLLQLQQYHDQCH